MADRINEVVLHIGLHKTGTKYFQHHVFPFLDAGKYVYNPPVLTQYLMDYLKADNEEDRQYVYKGFVEEMDALGESHGGKTLLISREIMCGDLFSAYVNWDECIAKLSELFPQARILCFLRYQTDWLVSCYRETLCEHHFQSFDEFIGARGKPGAATRNRKGLAVLDPYRLNYRLMLERLFESFPRDRVGIFFFEDFKKDMGRIAEKVLTFIRSSPVRPKRMKHIPNRGYSALAIAISRARNALFGNRLLSWSVHRPIFFWGENSIPAGNEHLSRLPWDKYWGAKFRRDNEEVRSRTYPKLPFFQWLRMRVSWRFLMKNGLDRIVYWDWDVMGKHRDSLDQHYRKVNLELAELLGDTPLPARYVEERPRTESTGSQ